jgi:hypothetical protein
MSKHGAWTAEFLPEAENEPEVEVEMQESVQNALLASIAASGRRAQLRTLVPTCGAHQGVSEYQAGRVTSFMRNPESDA